ncbi:MAG TPA: TetR/AcrR family transcriptional regulator [Amaricoccus sp.]|uniref:TetR/AcrR family transcriptional regulator n=1 Tax=Amaricoccus sp. TaxID=1872485 RepID=UPI002CBC4E44|nr:TetR/AcrR family transcriptional regulator [Amaricoccus sp.]HMQ92220.1 TetR/AcrR family transcriptional regulator [Amaricoccus sp.]HMR12197.1 TetR/AcrR family transcriptional regulator [Arachnia sp.]HMR51676.1 TetR/AcrR family transcriptional regulator [Amaricoccus sp.]HMT98388.1 TetR/AcrR family transcriptional regulator [Amaricoccus sp.]
MAKIDLVRRAEIGREKRARTRAQILEAGALLLAERPPEALTVDAVVEAAGVAKGTFYYHFLSISELAAAVGVMLGESFDEMLTPAKLELSDPVARLVFMSRQFLQKAISDQVWARLVVQSSQSPTEFGRGIREHLKADLAEAIAQGRMVVKDVDLAADIVIGMLLQIMRGIIERGAPRDLIREALDAVLRALGAAETGFDGLDDVLDGQPGEGATP